MSVGDFGSEERRVWLIYLNEITNILNHTISQSKLYAIYLKKNRYLNYIRIAFKTLHKVVL